jgi:hypothetical protein
MLCLTCNYDLRHLRQQRCPECGRTFNSTDPTTYLGKRSREPIYVLLFIVGLLLFFALLTFGMIAYAAWEGIGC